MFVGRKIIRCTLDTKDINRAIKEIEKYKKEFQKKIDTYRKRIAEEIAVNASFNFGSSVIEDVVGTVEKIDGKNKLILGGSPRRPDVEVSVSERESITVVVADGKDAIWCEFGAGVYHNGSVGSSPHPYGQDLGFTIGNYGEGHGKQNVWGFVNKDGKVIVTRGTPASMPMYNATQEVMRKAIDIAREVFND